LEFTDEALVVFLRDVQFRMVILIDFGDAVHSLGNPPKNETTLIDDALDVCFGSPCECATRIPEEVSPKMIGDLPSSLKLIFVMSEFLKEEVSMFHETGQIIHMDTNELIMSATILNPNIWICFAGIKSPNVHKCIRKEFMPSGSTSSKSIEGLVHDE
jgi:hypothetical protein